MDGSEVLLAMLLNETNERSAIVVIRTRRILLEMP